MPAADAADAAAVLHAIPDHVDATRIRSSAAAAMATGRFWNFFWPGCGIGKPDCCQVGCRASMSEKTVTPVQ
jgi:hypothetical protein